VSDHQEIQHLGRAISWQRSCPAGKCKEPRFPQTDNLTRANHPKGWDAKLLA